MRCRRADTSVNGTAMEAAALLTRMSMVPPSISTASGITRDRDWSSVRSATTDTIRVPYFWHGPCTFPRATGAWVSDITVLRSALTRSDVIIKAPSNDPLTAMAIARTLRDIAPDHPITKHLAVGYWKGGDEQV